MTRHDEESPGPGAAPADPPPGSTGPAGAARASDTTGTWGFISPFAASPGYYVTSGPDRPAPTAGPGHSGAGPDRPAPTAGPGGSGAGRPVDGGGPVDPPTGPLPTAPFGRPEWGPAGDPGWHDAATGAVGGGSWSPGGPGPDPRPAPDPGRGPGGPPADRPANQAPEQSPTWGAPVAGAAGGRPGRWKTWQKVAAGGVLAGVIAIGGVAAVSAANASSGTSGTTGSPAGVAGGAADSGFGGTGRTEGFGARGGMAGMLALADALHGDFVVADGSSTRTMRLQRGELSAVTGTSITVASTDGYTTTYTVGSGVDVSGLSTGETVLVVGTVDGDAVTATAVTSGTGTGTGTGMGMGGGPAGSGSGADGQARERPEGMAPPTA